MVRDIPTRLKPALASHQVVSKVDVRVVRKVDKVPNKLPGQGSAARATREEPSFALQQVRSAALFFFSVVALERKVLPKELFQDVLIKPGIVRVLRKPAERFALTTHRMLFAWLHCELPAFAEGRRQVTATLAMELGCEVLEAFQFSVRLPPVCYSTPSVEKYEESIQSVIRTVQLMCGTFARPLVGAKLVLDVAEGEVRFDNNDVVGMDVDLFNEEISFVSDNPVPPKYLSLTEKTVLGSIRCEKAVIYCAHFANPHRV